MPGRRSMLSVLLNRARQRKLHEVTVTLDELEKQWRKQKGRCHLTGIHLPDSDDDPRSMGAAHVSLDRLDPSAGYSVKNTKLVCTRVNLMKGNMTMDQFEWMCQKVVKNDGNRDRRKQRRHIRRLARMLDFNEARDDRALKQ
jgi:hypothetical protein